MTTPPNVPDPQPPAPSDSTNYELRTTNSPPPFLTADLPGTDGYYKSRADDFVVTEIPLYEAAGVGTHVYFQVTKTERTTMGAAAVIAKALGRRSVEIGFAGLKDARAVTTQWMSLEHVAPARLERIDLHGIQIGRITRHGNKLRTGHLSANQFDIKLREVAHDALARARAVLDVLTARGVPNYFGSQRFGTRGDGWLTGRFLLLGDAEGFCRQFLGRPKVGETPAAIAARAAFEAGRFQEAIDLWHPRHRDEKRALQTLVRGKSPGRALAAVDKKLRRFLVSAYQSHLFNKVLARRLDAIDRIVDGDLAYRHNHGAVFRVTDASIEQPRADAKEISPTGPIFGYRMTTCEGEPAEIEREILDAEGLTLESWRDRGRIRIKGGRRPLRFIPTDVQSDDGVDEFGPFLRLQFTLPSGCYATIILEEITKHRPRPLDEDIPAE